MFGLPNNTTTNLPPKITSTSKDTSPLDFMPFSTEKTPQKRKKTIKRRVPPLNIEPSISTKPSVKEANVDAIKNGSMIFTKSQPKTQPNTELITSRPIKQFSTSGLLTNSISEGSQIFALFNDTPESPSISAIFSEQNVQAYEYPENLTELSFNYQPTPYTDLLSKAPPTSSSDLLPKAFPELTIDREQNDTDPWLLSETVRTLPIKRDIVSVLRTCKGNWWWLDGKFNKCVDKIESALIDEPFSGVADNRDDVRNLITNKMVASGYSRTKDVSKVLDCFFQRIHPLFSDASTTNAKAVFQQARHIENISPNRLRELVGGSEQLHLEIVTESVKPAGLFSCCCKPNVTKERTK